MRRLTDRYRGSLALLTDLYQVTMACGYWKEGTHEREAVFHLFFRRPPFGGRFAIAAGLADAVDWITGFRCDDQDIAHLRGLTGNDDRPLFAPGFLEWLAELQITCDIDAMPEGTPAFPHEPLLRVRGPLAQCQLLETPLLNIINFQTLIATKAARVCRAAENDTVLEFGLRRAQGPDGGLSAARAAWLGGCHATSNVLAGRIHDIPVKGTHAHSWVMSFEDEPESFAAYARALPNNSVFLVDTYDTLDGVRNAIRSGRWLREQGHEMVGVRLDSGDLAELSIAARQLLDEAGFSEAKILASNDLDEYTITDLKARGARIDIWGVGTKLVTAGDQPALGGVYKLAAIRNDDGTWDHKVKLSEQSAKSTNPGIQQVRRFYREGLAIADAIYSETDVPADNWQFVDFDGETTRTMAPETSGRDLLAPILRRGRPVGTLPSLDESRQYCADQLQSLPGNIQTLEDPAGYPVGLEAGLHRIKQNIIQDIHQRRNVT